MSPLQYYMDVFKGAYDKRVFIGDIDIEVPEYSVFVGLYSPFVCFWQFVQ